MTDLPPTPPQPPAEPDLFELAQMNKPEIWVAIPEEAIKKTVATVIGLGMIAIAGGLLFQGHALLGGAWEPAPLAFVGGLFAFGLGLLTFLQTGELQVNASTDDKWKTGISAVGGLAVLVLFSFFWFVSTPWTPSVMSQQLDSAIVKLKAEIKELKHEAENRKQITESGR